MSLRVEVVTTLDGLIRIGPAWDHVVDQAGITHPFLSHDWVRSWWEAFGARRVLKVLLIKDQDELIGIAPLMISRTAFYGLPVRELGFIYNDHTPRFDFIVLRDQAAVYDAISQHLKERRKEWDVMKLCQLVSDSPTLAEVARVWEESNYRVGLWPSTSSPYLTVSGAFDDHFASLPRGVRTNLKRRLKRLEEHGPVEFERVSDPAEIDVALAEAFQMEAGTWKGAEGTAMDCRPEVKKFYTLLAHRAARNGTLYLTFLRLNGARIAFDLSVIYKDRLFKLKPGYSMEYHACSPGAQLTALTIRDAFERGLTEVDFLGDADLWKLAWTRTTRQNNWVYLFPPTILGRLLHFAKFQFIPWLKSSPFWKPLREEAA